MTIKISDALANAMADALEVFGGTSPKLQLFTGSIPADETASTGASVKVLEATLPSDWLLNSVAGVKSKNGTWSGAAIAAGVVTYFRLTNAAGVAFLQGSVTGTGGGGDATLDNTNIAVAQVVSATSFSFTMPGL